jgi:hypothetical protein
VLKNDVNPLLGLAVTINCCFIGSSFRRGEGHPVLVWLELLVLLFDLVQDGIATPLHRQLLITAPRYGLARHVQGAPRGARASCVCVCPTVCRLPRRPRVFNHADVARTRLDRLVEGVR